MSLNEVIRCLGVNFLLMGYLVCATLVHIALNSSKILKELQKMNKDNRHDFELQQRAIQALRHKIFEEEGKEQK